MYEVKKMNIDRRTYRIELMILLYQDDLYQSENIPFEPQFVNEEVEKSYQEIKENLSAIDHIIEEQLVNYTLNRLSYPDRAIIRVATFELMFTEIPKEIIINEAIEITKIYTTLDDEKQRKFNHRLIDQIASAVRG